MRHAAGADVYSFDFNKAQILRYIQLGPVFYFSRVLGEPGIDFEICPHRLVGGGFYLSYLFTRKLGVEVAGEHLRHVEAHIVAAEPVVGYSAHNVFGTVVLHAAQSGFPVYRAVYFSGGAGPLKDSEEPDAIAAELAAHVDGILGKRFGTSIPAIVALQGESMKRRLAAFAKIQAVRHAEGWRTARLVVRVPRGVSKIGLLAQTSKLAPDETVRFDDFSMIRLR